jgi:nucleotide-binding universal stress UspA family protein
MAPMKTVIVPLDGSETAERALPIAAGIAAQMPTRIVLLCSRLGAELEDPEGYLSAAALAWNISDAEPLVVYDRPAAAAIEFVHEDYDDAIVVMSTHGRGGVRRALLGSVAEAVLQRAVTPMVLVGPQADVQAWKPGPIIVGLDASAAGEAILEAATEMAVHLNQQMWLVQVVQPGLETPESDGAAVESAYVEHHAQPLLDAGLDAAWEVLHADAPAHALNAFARSRHASLIAVSTHGRTGVQRAIFGSVAQDVVRDAPCPVLIVPRATAQIQ